MRFVALAIVTAGLVACRSSASWQPETPAPAGGSAWRPPRASAGQDAGVSTPLWVPAEPSTRRAWVALEFAWQQLGRAYCWGGTGPGCFDCSGLVQRAWASAGVRLPRTSEEIAAALSPVGRDHMRPGDVLWWPGHVALYAGNGWEIEALDHRHGVVLRPLKEPTRAFRFLE